MAQKGAVAISNGKDRCRGAKKGHGTELRCNGLGMNSSASKAMELNRNEWFSKGEAESWFEPQWHSTARSRTAMAKF